MLQSADARTFGLPTTRQSACPARLAFLAAVIGCNVAISAADETTRVICPIVADTTISNAQPPEAVLSFAHEPIMRLQNLRSFAVLQFDIAPAEGLLVQKATLRVRRDKTLLTRVGISTVATTWSEGPADDQHAQAGEDHEHEQHPVEGAPCFAYAAFARDPRNATWWAGGGSDFTNVIFGNGGSRWASVVAAFDKDSMWYEIPIPAPLAQALVEGLQPGGLCLSDDFGRDEAVPTIFSRESEYPPELVIEGVRTASKRPTPAPTNVTAWRDDFGLEWVGFEAPTAIGFEVYLSDQPLKDASGLAGGTVPVRPWLMPSPEPGPLRALLSLDVARTHRYVGVRTVTTRGEWSDLVGAPLPPRIDAHPHFELPLLPRHSLPEVLDRPFTCDDGPSLSLDGKWMRNAGKTWWDPFKGPITLEGGRNEFVAFQVFLAGGPGRYAVTLADWQSPDAIEPAPQVRLYRQAYVQIPFGREKYAPEVAIPLEAGMPLELDLLTPAAASQPATPPRREDVAQGVWVEFYIPDGAARGMWRNRVIVLRDGKALLDAPIELNVSDVSLPDELGFDVALESEIPPAAALGAPADDPQAWDAHRDFQRLAHEHRTTLCVVPYTPGGEVIDGFAPKTTRADVGIDFDFGAWDRRFAEYFTGLAFRGLPRDGQPLKYFYLPFHENWPVPFDPMLAPADAPLAQKYHYRTTWTEIGPLPRPSPPMNAYQRWPVSAALGAKYKDQTEEAARKFVNHIRKQAWGDTRFVFTLRNDPALRGGSSWWFFSSPRVADDFQALAFWLGMYRAAIGEAEDPVSLIQTFVGIPALERDSLAGITDITVTSDALFSSNRILNSHRPRYGRLWNVDFPIDVAFGGEAAQKWAWTARLAGAQGLVVRRALGTRKSWERASNTTLIYPPREDDAVRPLASLRLKALRRAQQDMELFGMWLEKQSAAGLPEGYGLAIVGREIAVRSDARSPVWSPLVPVIQFPNQMDTVVFEEIRRGLRQALAP